MFFFFLNFMALFYGWSSTASMLHVLAVVLTMPAKRNIIFMEEQRNMHIPIKRTRDWVQFMKIYQYVHSKVIYLTCSMYKMNDVN